MCQPKSVALQSNFRFQDYKPFNFRAVENFTSHVDRRNILCDSEATSKSTFSSSMFSLARKVKYSGPREWIASHFDAIVHESHPGVQLPFVLSRVSPMTDACSFAIASATQATLFSGQEHHTHRHRPWTRMSTLTSGLLGWQDCQSAYSQVCHLVILRFAESRTTSQPVCH